MLKISASSIKTFTQCPQKYYFNYIEKAPRKEWEHLLLGNFCHKVLELFHKHCMENKVSKSEIPKLIKKIFLDTKKEFNLSDVSFSEAHLILKDYLDSVKNSMPNVKGVEIPFEFKLEKNLEIRGFIDRIDEVDGKLKIIDYKTTKNAKYLDSFQLAIYGLCLQNEYNLDSFSGSYVLLRHKSTTKDYDFNLKDLEKTKKDLIKYAYDIKKEKNWNPNPSILCKWCDFKDICESQKSSW